MNYQRLLLSALLALMLLPGCGSRKKKGTAPAQESGSTTYTTTSKKQKVFDEDLEAFALQDDQNLFEGPSKGSGEDRGGTWSPEGRQGDFETIYYEYDRSEIRPDQKATLNRNAAQIKKINNKGQKVLVEGHACVAGGSAQYNMALSEKRAKSAKKYLVSQGVDAKMIKTVGRGSEMLRVDAGTTEQQAPNRRVEFYILE